MQEGLHIALKADQVGQIFGLPITNTMIMGWMVMIVLIVIGWLVGRNLQKIPSRVQTFFEALFGFIIDYMEEVFESRPLALRFFPLIATLFTFILLGNWFGLLPIVNSIGVIHGEELIPLFHPVSTDLNITLALAIIAFFAIEISGIAYIGALKYAGKFVNLKSPIGFLVGIIELLSELARLVSFSFRLFGNMFAGKTLILVAMFFVPYLLPVPLMLYEVFVGFIQASIFALLTLFFIKLAIAEPH